MKSKDTLSASLPSSTPASRGRWQPILAPGKYALIRLFLSYTKSRSSGIRQADRTAFVNLLLGYGIDQAVAIAVGVGRRDRAPRRLSAEIAGHLVAALNDDRIWMAERSLLTCMDHRVEVVIWLLEVAAALEPAGHRSTDERGKTAVPNVTRTCRSRFSCGRQLWVDSGHPGRLTSTAGSRGPSWRAPAHP